MPANSTGPGSIETDALVADACRAACRATRLEDWGETAFLSPLAQLSEAFRERYGPDKVMALQFRSAVTAILINRLYIEETLKGQPGILQVPVPRPLFIVGLARTGSTLLHRLMARHAASRPLLYWEMNFPFSGANMGLNHREMSLKLAHLKIQQIMKRYPGYDHIHRIEAEAPEECNVLMRHTFCSLSIASEWLLPEYGQWLVRQDLTDSYRYYRKLLQLLLWHRSGAFLLLKCPSHILNLAAILTVFPDANFVWLHRQPAQAIPSYLDLLSAFWPDHSDGRSFTEFICDYSRRSVEIGRTMQRQIDPGQFLNVAYRELVKDPTGVIAAIYRYFNYEADPGLEERISQWLARDARQERKPHAYSPEQFGLTAAEIEEKLSGYCREYAPFLESR
jgi:hypothetical protein